MPARLGKGVVLDVGRMNHKLVAVDVCAVLSCKKTLPVLVHMQEVRMHCDAVQLVTIMVAEGTVVGRRQNSVLLSVCSLPLLMVRNENGLNARRRRKSRPRPEGAGRRLEELNRRSKHK